MSSPTAASRPSRLQLAAEAARDAYKQAAMEQTPGFVDTISGATGLTYMSNIAVRMPWTTHPPDKAHT